ncbi:MAG TPA: hypothetical protein VNW68_05515 [Candidatus Limnocylindria bacterium]|nr:hypothetical protein [Candidatus Limnocylindria bacterium]
MPTARLTSPPPAGPRVAVAASLFLFALGVLFLARVDPARRESD